MSTRATIHFTTAAKDEATAIIYRHSDGHPDGLGKDLNTFFKDVKAQTDDTRYNDPSYLAAKWVVWDSKRHGDGNLNFLGVGVVQRDPGDIEYRYRVICNGRSVPRVICEEVE